MKNMSIEETCARAAHEVNRAYCAALGDASQLPWEEAPDWQKSSARNGVRGALSGDTPEASHNSWVAEKVATGWKHGPVKDPEKKEHPCMVPFHRLPLSQRMKDQLFVSIVLGVLAHLDKEAKNPNEGCNEG